MNILLFGPPGAGKGTQSELLVARLGMKHISTGDLFRLAIKNKTPLGLEAKSHMDKGNLVPDSITIGLAREALVSVGKSPFILDGFPRNIYQADALEEILESLGLTLDKAIFIEVSQSELVSRLSGRRVCRTCGAVYHVQAKPPKNGKNCDQCGGEDIYQRADDKAESIQTRLQVYEESTKPVKDFYLKKRNLVVVDGLQNEEEVFASLKRQIAP